MIDSKKYRTATLYQSNWFKLRSKKNNYSFDRYLLPKVFLRNAYDRKLEDADQEQSMLSN